MGFYSGRDGELYIGGSKAAKVQSWSFSSSMAVLETSSLGDTDRTLKAGMRSYSGSCRLFYYVESAGGVSNLHSLLTKSIKTVTGGGTSSTTSSDHVILKLRMTTGNTDLRDIQFLVFITGVSMSTAVGEVASADISWEANGAPYGAEADLTLIN